MSNGVDKNRSGNSSLFKVNQGKSSHLKGVWGAPLPNRNGGPWMACFAYGYFLPYWSRSLSVVVQLPRRPFPCDLVSRNGTKRF